MTDRTSTEGVHSGSPEDPQVDPLEQVSELTKNARKTFFVMVSACLYSLLTIGTTSDVAIIANSAVFPLPVVGTHVPVAWFYGAAPFLLLCVYVYFHLYLQRLWRGLSSLPAVLADGTPVDEYVYPWIISNALLRAKVPSLRVIHQRFSRVEWLLSVALGWWIVPVTIGMFWLRYLTRHDRLITGIQVVLLAFSLGAAVVLYRNAVSTLRGRETSSPARGRLDGLIMFAGFVLVMLSSGALFGFLSVGAIAGRPAGSYAGSDGPVHPGVRVLQWIRISPFAQLEGQAISKKHPGWTGESKGLARQIDLVEGASLARIDLRHARASGAFMVAANLDSADLQWADLSGVQLQGAMLERANLRQARLNGAQLERARLNGAHLEAADLDHANLQFAEVRDSFLSHAILTHGKLRNAIGRGADFTGADMRFSDLTDADMEYARFEGTSLKKAIMDNASLDSAVFHKAELQSAKLRAASLVKADFREAILYHANLTGADLYRGEFERANLAAANLRGAMASRAVFEEADISGGDCEGTDLRFANFKGADLSEANLRDADLRMADLSDAKLIQADLTAAILTDAALRGARLPGADMTNAVGLTAGQLEGACGDSGTRLPDGLEIETCK